MELNIKTATNEELRKVQGIIQDEFNSLQSQMRDIVKQMEGLSESYNKIQSVLDKREGGGNK